METVNNNGMVFLSVASMLVMAAYAAAVCVRQKGVPASISATFYKLRHPYWFLATMWLTAGLLMPAILEVSRPGTEFLAFLACAGMMLVGAAPNFKEETEGKAHTAGAVLCIVGSQAWVACNSAWCLLAWAAYAVFTAVMMTRHVSDSIVSDFLRTKPMFWVEVAALVSTCLSVTIKM